MKIDKEMLKQIKAMPLHELQKFLIKFYNQAYFNGINADVDPNIKYVAIKKGVTYECGWCGAELTLEEEVEQMTNEDAIKYFKMRVAERTHPPTTAQQKAFNVAIEALEKQERE